MRQGKSNYLLRGRAFMSKRPIEPQAYMYGIKVVDIGDLRVARGKTRVPAKSCRHQRMVYDEAVRRVYCEDCEQDVEPFDAFVLLVQQHDSAWKKIQRASNEASEAAKFQLRSRAAKVIDQVWRSRNMVPNCPHCREALLPEDILEVGFSRTSAELARKKRERRQK